MAQNTEWLLGFLAAMSVMSRIEFHVTEPLSDLASRFLGLVFLMCDYLSILSLIVQSIY